MGAKKDTGQEKRGMRRSRSELSNLQRIEEILSRTLSNLLSETSYETATDHFRSLGWALAAIEDVTGSYSVQLRSLQDCEEAKNLRMFGFLDKFGMRLFGKDSYRKSKAFRKAIRSNLVSYNRKIISVSRQIIKDYSPHLKNRATGIEDVKVLLSLSEKVIFLRAAGITACQLIAVKMRKKLRKASKGDDIMALYKTLKEKTTDLKLKRFLTTSYRRFEDAGATRQRCAHIDRGNPTKAEVRAVLDFAVLIHEKM